MELRERMGDWRGRDIGWLGSDGLSSANIHYLGLRGCVLAYGSCTDRRGDHYLARSNKFPMLYRVHD